MTNEKLENRILLAGQPRKYSESLRKEGYLVDEATSGWFLKNKNYLAIVASEDVNFGACGGWFGSIRKAREMNKEVPIYFMSDEVKLPDPSLCGYRDGCLAVTSGSELAGVTERLNIEEYSVLLSLLNRYKK